MLAQRLGNFKKSVKDLSQHFCSLGWRKVKASGIYDVPTSRTLDQRSSGKRGLAKRTPGAHLPCRSQEPQPRPLRSRCLDTHVSHRRSLPAAHLTSNLVQRHCSQLQRRWGLRSFVLFPRTGLSFLTPTFSWPLPGPSQSVPHGQKDPPLSPEAPFLQKGHTGTRVD